MAEKQALGTGTLSVPVFNQKSLTNISQSDVFGRIDPTGKVNTIIEALAEKNEILQDIPFIEANLPNGLVTTIRNGLPDVYWRRYNMGTPTSKSQTVQIQESCAMMQSISQVDSKLVELANDKAMFRKSEDAPFIEAMGQVFANSLFYGDQKKTPEAFNGFECRYSTLKKDVPSSKNVIDCGGTGDDLVSIYIVGWGDNVTGFYPKGSLAGLRSTDCGETVLKDDSGHEFMGYKTIYNWDVGLAVRDWRYVVRLCNISLGDLFSNKGIGKADVRTEADSTNLILKLSQGINQIPNGGRTNIAIYMNSETLNGLNNLSARANSNVITIDQGIDQYGNRMTWQSFLGYPLRRVDQLKVGEKKVV